VSTPEHVKRRISWQRVGYGLRYALAFTAGVTVAAVGDVISFSNLRKFASEHTFPIDWGLPVVLDAGIPAFLLLDSMRPSKFFRVCAWVLSAITVVANVAVTPDPSWISRGLHGLAPAVSILWYEAMRHLHDDDKKMDRVRLMRYLVSPVRTVRLRVRMIRWEVTSYSSALALESGILHARAVLVSEYRRQVWRRTRKAVPVILRHQLDTGQLPVELLGGPGWQVAVRAWVIEALDELDPRRHADHTGKERTIRDQIRDDLYGEPRPWDQIWDRRDELVPRGVNRLVFFQSIGPARDHFEQAKRPISGSKLVGLIGGAKGRANAIAAVLKTAIEAGVDQAVAPLDSDPPAKQTGEQSAETNLDRSGPNGLGEDDRVPVGGAS